MLNIFAIFSLMLILFGLALGGFQLLMFFKPEYKDGPLSQFETESKDQIPFDPDDLPLED